MLVWRRASPRRLAPAKRPTLVVVGSPNPTSLAQIAHLERRGFAAVIRAEIREILGGLDRFKRELEGVLGKALTEIRAGRDVVITLAQPFDPGRSSASHGNPAAAKRLRPLPPSASATLSEFLGRSARDLTRRFSSGGLVLCGGDIAVATCRALRADGIILGGEVQPGVPWGRLVGGEQPGFPVVTKAGGFGKPDVFHAAIRFLRHGRAG
jgi:uncharacterized protein YgbK (DUF1537 family)